MAWVKTDQNSIFTALSGLGGAAAILMFFGISLTGVDVATPHFIWGILSAILTFSVCVTAIYNGYSLRTERARRQSAEAAVQAQKSIESRLTIHSAVYGASSMNDIDVTDVIKALPREGLIVSVDNNSLKRDPAPNQVKRLKVEYSYGNNQIVAVECPEYGRLVLPQSYIFVPSAAPQSDADRKRYQRAMQQFAKLTVPQKFTLRLICRFDKIHRDQLVSLAQQAGFGANPADFVDRLSNDSELVTSQSGGDFQINPVFIGHIESILRDWFIAVSDPSKTL